MLVAAVSATNVITGVLIVEVMTGPGPSGRSVGPKMNGVLPAGAVNDNTLATLDMPSLSTNDTLSMMPLALAESTKAIPPASAATAESMADSRPDMPVAVGAGAGTGAPVLEEDANGGHA